jgi:hypothetical protein
LNCFVRGVTGSFVGKTKRCAEIVARTMEPVLVPGFVKRPWRDACILRLIGIKSKL